MRIDSERIENEGLGVLEGIHGILVAPGFGARGVNGKLLAIQYARENKIPFLGICFGMQLACVEFARNVCGLADAMTSEVDETTPDPVIDFLPDQRNLDTQGRDDASGRLRLRRSSPTRWRPRRTARCGSASAIATATSSTTRTRRSSRSTGCASRGTTRSAGRRSSR